MDIPNIQKQGPDKAQFNQEQYDLLLRCSKKQDMKDWNEWRKQNPKEKIFLEEANLKGANLEGAHLENAYLRGAHLERADLILTYLEGADLFIAKMQGIVSFGAHLENAGLNGAHLENAKFIGAFLNGASLINVHLEGTDFSGSTLYDTKFEMSIVDNSTSLYHCKVNKNTDFRGVSLESLRIKSATKQLLKYVIRRKNWEEWYRGNSDKKWKGKVREFVTSPVRLFWFVSDYGISTGRIILTFFVLAIAFAMVYLLWPSCVMVNNVAGDIRGFVHALYFSVVTMTTLGFGDIAANPDSWFGQVVLMVQVILGYVHLGALVTRFAVLFTAGGPAGKFSKESKKKGGK